MYQVEVGAKIERVYRQANMSLIRHVKSSKAKRELSRVRSRVFRTKTYEWFEGRPRHVKAKFKVGVS